MINVEIKARATLEQQQQARAFVVASGGLIKGTDLQTDTYFKVPHGRLKLREGNIENCLIQYDRPNQCGPKISKYRLVYFKPDCPAKDALVAALGILAVVVKEREICYLDNVKIHFDCIEGLGRFIEIEARDELENIGLDRLGQQAANLIEEFQIKPEDLVKHSYSDMILQGK